MRLWHKDLIPALPRQQLLGQWRELCSIMRNIEKNGTPNHVLVNKIMDYDKSNFYQYAVLVSEEMKQRGYKCDFSKFGDNSFIIWVKNHSYITWSGTPMEASYDGVFPGWMNDRYLLQCFYNLQEKYDCGAISENDFSKIYNVCKHAL